MFSTLLQLERGETWCLMTEVKLSSYSGSHLTSGTVSPDLLQQLLYVPF